MSERKKILLLAGEELAIYFKRILEREGYDIIISNSKGYHEKFCQEVRSELSREKIDMVIPTNFSDFIPDSIIMIIPVIREFDPNIRILAMSGYVGSDFMKKLEASPIDGFIQFPIEPKYLISRIEQIFLQ